MDELRNMEDGERELYLALCRRTTYTLEALAEELGCSQEWVGRALGRLADLGLAVASDAPLGLRAASPAVALGPRLADAEHDLLGRQAELVSARAELDALVAEYERTRDRDAVIRLASLEETRARLEDLARSARRECVSLNPGRAQPPDARAASTPLNQLALERGVAIRCVYQDAFRNDPATLKYADWLVELGGEARTMPVVPLQIVIVDREVALVPLDPDDHRLGALEVRSPGMLAALCALFDHLWAAAVPFHHERHRPVEALAAFEREVLHLLGRGLTDEAVARKLGVSVRTVRRVVASLCEQLGATSRFAAGALAHERGWLE